MTHTGRWKATLAVAIVVAVAALGLFLPSTARAWHDGEWRGRTLSEFEGDIYVRDRATGTEWRLTSDGRSHDPIWSYSGEEVAYLSERDGQTDVYRVKYDGSGTERLTHDEIIEGFLAYSRAGALHWVQRVAGEEGTKNEVVRYSTERIRSTLYSEPG